MLTAAMLERLRAQLPMAGEASLALARWPLFLSDKSEKSLCGAVVNFESVGYIFSAGAADAALAAGAPPPPPPPPPTPPQQQGPGVKA